MSNNLKKLSWDDQTDLLHEAIYDCEIPWHNNISVNRALTLLDNLTPPAIRDDIRQKIDNEMQEISRQIVELKAKGKTAECINLNGIFGGLNLALKLGGLNEF